MMDICSIDMEQLAQGMWSIVDILIVTTVITVGSFVAVVAFSIKLGYMKW